MSRIAFVTKVAVASACTGVLSLGLLGGAASADDGVGIDVQLPVTVCGNGIGLFTPGSGTCPTPTNPPAPVSVDPGALVGGLLGGDPAAAANVNAPITVCGNGIGGTGSCAPAAGAPAPSSGGAGGLVDVGANAPITVCGNGIGLLDPATGSCTTGGSAAAAPAGDPSTGGLLDGGLAGVDAAVPVTVCGNAVGVLAGASSSCAQAAAMDSTPTTTPGTTPGTTPATTQPAMQNVVGSTDPGLSTSLITGALSPLLNGNLAVTGTAAGLIGLVGLLTLGAGRFATVLSRLPGRS